MLSASALIQRDGLPHQKRVLVLRTGVTGVSSASRVDCPITLSRKKASSDLHATLPELAVQLER
jgi:hypothetical protein